MANKTSVPAFDEVFNDQDWTIVDRTQLIDCARFFDSDPNVQTGFSFRMDALLNGGLLFSKAGKTMNGKAKEFMSTEFTRVLKEIVRNRWYAGYAACAWEDHPEFVGKPVVLDLTQIVTRKKKSIFGNHEYKYFHQPYDGFSAEKEIMNVVTFTFDAPDIYGNLRSLVTMLAQDHMYETMLTHYSLVAMKGRAQPVFVTEKEREVYDRDAIRAPTARTPTEISMGIMGGQTRGQEMQIPNNTDVIIQHSEALYNRMQPAMTNTIIDTLESIQQQPHFAAHYQLEQGRKFTAAPMPEGPADLLPFRIARAERAFQLMGVPPALVTNSTSAGGAKTRESQTSNSYVLFDNAQGALKLELISIAKTLYYSIHLKTHLANYLRDTPAKEWSADAAAKSAEVSVEMPSMPDEEKLMSLYTMGFMKFESVVAYLSAKHGIPKESFNTKCGLDLLELNGMHDKPEPPAAKKAKK